jgi:hypothetical protein
LQHEDVFPLLLGVYGQVPSQVSWLSFLFS